MIQTIKEILRRFCAYGMEYKDQEGYTHDWVTLLPAVQLASNTSQHSTTGKTPALVEKVWNPLLPVDHLKKNLLTIHPTAKTSEDERLICRDLHYHQIDRENAVEVKLTEELSRKHPVFPVMDVEDSPGPVKKIINARKMRLNGKDQRQYLVRFKNQTADKNKWLAEDAITDWNLHLRRFRASGGTEQSHQ
ncbi:hypothetical protein O181_006424 [Austropuccinia psidii MF-1]|uniref:Uncharacterized protein n=1 Tax=Austropuccinia psidii MF-1 TaxID=1389203 RepID=A0A9Q3BJ97_9BASI|nr:hypothetical protein [Austropuccinia psidii MF-1]